MYHRHLWTVFLTPKQSNINQFFADQPVFHVWSASESDFTNIVFEENINRRRQISVYYAVWEQTGVEIGSAFGGKYKYNKSHQKKAIFERTSLKIFGFFNCDFD